MTLPNYKRPFEESDFRGHFTLTTERISRLSGPLYHSCHLDHALAAVKHGYLELRSECHIELPNFGLTRLTGVWLTLNSFMQNFYGPVTFTIDPGALENRKFIAFRRKDSDGRYRYFFLQHDSEMPVYMKDGQQRRSVKFESYFHEGKDETLWPEGRAIYDFFITMPVPIATSAIKAEDHPKCISKLCGGGDDDVAGQILQTVAKEEITRRILESTKKIDERYPQLFQDADQRFQNIVEIISGP